jgi:nucleoside-diphosphate-sugar epimerase
VACLTKKDRIFVAGQTGLVGTALMEILQDRGYDNLVWKTRRDCDFREQHDVRKLFRWERPTVLFVSTGRVGGIAANDMFRADFIRDNLLISTNLISAAHEFGVHRLIFLGSSCIYPRQATQPMPETALLTGPLEYTNRPYAIAKLAGLELVNSLRKQHGCDFFTLMPTNLYGPCDNFHPTQSHVVPALIRRFQEAKNTRAKAVTIWGSGRPLREFLYSFDLAEAILFLAEHLTFEALENSAVGQAGWSHINVGSGEEISIADLGTLIARVLGFHGNIEFDSTRPDGTPRKLLDCSLLRSLGWTPQTKFENGLNETFRWFAQEQL